MRSAALFLLSLLFPVLIANAVVWKDYEEPGSCIVEVGVQSMQNTTSTCYNIAGDILPNGNGVLFCQVLLKVIPQSIHNQQGRYSIQLALYDTSNPPICRDSPPAFSTPPLGDTTWTSATRGLGWLNIPNMTRSTATLSVTVSALNCACQGKTFNYPVVFIPGGARTVTITASPDPLPRDSDLTIQTNWISSQWDQGSLVRRQILEGIINTPNPPNFMTNNNDDSWPASPATSSYHCPSDDSYHGAHLRAWIELTDSCGTVYAVSNEVTLE